MTTPTKTEEETVISIWDKVSESYDQLGYWARPETHAWLEILVSHIGELGGKEIIEVGCGSGFMSVALAKRGSICSVLDISEVAMKRVLESFKKDGLPEPKYFIQDALNNNIQSESYDIVWNAGVIEHFKDQEKEQMVREMWRMTKPLGKIVIMVPNSLCWQAQLSQKWQELRKTWRYGFQDNMSPKRLQRLCKKIGLSSNDVYAFDPVIGWCWLPILGAYMKKWMGPKTINDHLQKSWRGYLSVLVIQKNIIL